MRHVTKWWGCVRRSCFGESLHAKWSSTDSCEQGWLSTEVRVSCIILWVCNQRMFPPSGLRLADKRSLPCPKRNEWLVARDELYEEIMHKAWNPTLQVFGQSYEETDVLDSSVLIMPLVFFMTPVSV